MYHIVCPGKYRRAVITEEVDKKLKEICLEIENRYEIKFLEIRNGERPCVFSGPVSAFIQSSKYSTEDNTIFLYIQILLPYFFR